MKNKRHIFWEVLFWIVLLAGIYMSFGVYLKDAKSIFIGIIAGVTALLFAAIKTAKIMSHDRGTDAMSSISNNIYAGAMAFLKREYSILAVFVVIIAGLIAYFLKPETAICFLCGAACSALAGYIGMTVSTKSNTRTAHAAESSLNKAFRIAFSGGVVMGMTVAGLGLLGLTILYYIFKDHEIINGFALGASSIALFARVGGGIFTKAADVGADLVGKVEAGIPEDDHRNPAVIADNVGDNVGDVAGMGADLFESYVGSIIAAITLGAICLNLMGAFLPIVISGLGIFVLFIAVYFVRTKENGDPMKSLQIGTSAAMLMVIAGSYFVITNWIPKQNGGLGIFFALLIGIAAGTLIGYLTEYFTSYNFNPVKRIAKSTQTGTATTVISGLDIGMLSTFFPMVIISIATIAAFLVIGGMNNYTLGVYGISIAAVGMLSTVGIIVAVDAYGPISDNAGGIAQMADLDKTVRERTDKLDSVGNTTAAIGKGFAIGSAALTALALLCAYATVIDLENIDILNPFVTSGVLLGASLPFLFCSLTMGAVGRAAEKMVNEVRRQFKENPGIMTHQVQPDYKKCVDISTKAAILEMLLPGIIAIGAPILVGVGISLLTGEKTLGAQALGGLLMGAITTGVCLAIMMANTGGAWDNAKKYIEEGNFGGKGSAQHAASVVGDTIGDPFKDTSGPSLNILIKLMTIVSLVCATLFIA